MSKYFYTNPLKAAWMSHTFNMQILSCIGAPLRPEGIVSLGFGEKFYIHSDCYNMLPAQLNDIITINYDDEYILKVISDADWQEGKQSEDFKHNKISLSDVENCDYKIIQRDGEAFFMPEVEE